MKLRSGRFLAISGVALAVVGLLGFSLMAPTASIGQVTDVPPTTVDDVEAQPSNANPGLGDDVTIDVTVLDAAGDPVADTDCTVSITSQPGTDASVTTPDVTTDADGTASATVNVGNTSGTVEVKVDCGGVTALVSLVAAEAAPPASLPSAGTGTDFAANPMGPARIVALILLAALGVTLVGTGTVLTLAQRRASK